jgi:hypothetical protein
MASELADQKKNDLVYNTILKIQKDKEKIYKRMRKSPEEKFNKTIIFDKDPL